MSETFARFRLTAYIIFFLLSVAVLGLAANFASEFLPHLHSDFITFSLVVSVASIVCLILLLSWSQPRTEIIFVVIVGILWLSEASWAQDIIGHVQCSDVPSSDTIPTKSGTTSSRGYCRQMKVIEAFSWMLFGLFFISFWIIIALASRAVTQGNEYAWRQPIPELPWFGESVGYYGMEEGLRGGGYPGQPYPSPYPQALPGQPLPMTRAGSHGMMAQAAPGPRVGHQQPGQSLLVHPGQGGTGVTQVPGYVQSVV
ncbi:hypothetical protein PUNSTDRAFT_130950 [Punctularia strigosozonata HHB-11173 SS5]|uniref:uncharacterized protein n=1 Tax=Punctularia strigosozonata (strain HHB-11173) TaxID=741275 RepID=UPI00044184E9|nr:uncharacterized protein PUNSTDRAFT_130950 [Punctularia strigosozonata HHB-11173 SS5]EIN12702.1 hypothetical protein PUNSTDRAFT_130950 [Punctularia strigosozonata HHB-11173 SS5]